MMGRQTFIRVVQALLASLLVVTSGVRAADAPAAQPLMKVWKSPTCGCCVKWIKRMEAAGFRVESMDVDNVDPIKTANGVPLRLASCHTARVDGYVIEGHVPVEDVRRLLKERPGIVGLTVPGMPPGSPGMDIPASPPFDVRAFGKDGTTSVYATHNN